MANIHLKSAFDHIRRSPYQGLAAIFVLTLTFFAATVVSILVYSSGKVLQYFETRPQVIAFLKDEVPAEEVSKLQQKLQQDARITEIRYVSKEQALEIYKEVTSENPLLSELIDPSIFPASIEFSLSDLSQAETVISEMRQEQIVDQVGFTASLKGDDSLTDVVQKLRNTSYYVRLGGSILVGFLALTSFLVLLIIIGLRMTTRRSEIEVLNLIGATNSFVRSPIVIEAVAYALIGVFLGWVFALMSVLYATPSLLAYFAEVPVLPRDTAELFTFFGIMLGIELLMGLVIALGGSFLAVSRVRKTR